MEQVYYLKAMIFETFDFKKVYGTQTVYPSIARVLCNHDFLVLAFSRTKGHGFLKGSGGDSIFFHVSDVNGEVGLMTH